MYELPQRFSGQRMCSLLDSGAKADLLPAEVVQLFVLAGRDWLTRAAGDDIDRRAEP